MSEGQSMPERGRKIPEIVASEKAQDILGGNALIHFTRLEKLPGILSKGIMSPKFAESAGETVTAQYSVSKGDYVYFYRQYNNPDKNKMLLTILGNPSVWAGGNVAVLTDSEGIPSENAVPAFGGSYGREQQAMTHLHIPREKIIGVAIIAGPLGKYLDPELQKDIQEVIKTIQAAGAENSDYAVPVYDQNGNMLWPVEKTREEIIQSI